MTIHWDRGAIHTQIQLSLNAMANETVVFVLFSASESLTAFERANREIGVPRSANGILSRSRKLLPKTLKNGRSGEPTISCLTHTTLHSLTKSRNNIKSSRVVITKISYTMGKQKILTRMYRWCGIHAYIRRKNICQHYRSGIYRKRFIIN